MSGATCGSRCRSGHPGYTQGRGLHLLQLLQAARRAHFRRHWRIRKTRLPVGDADLADIDVAFRIQRDAVRREELADLDACAMLAAETGDALAFGVDEAEPRTEIGHFQIYGHAGAKLADDEGRVLAAAAAAQRAGAVQIVPLRLVFAVAVEHLHA